METLPACDSHLHLADLLPHQPDCLERLRLAGEMAVSSCHSRTEVTLLADALARDPRLAPLVGISFGIHPQLPVRDEWEFLVELATGASPGAAGILPPPRLPRLVAIGECGFDFYLGREMAGPHGEALQEEIFLDQAHLALATGLPLVIHIRRATDLMFRHVRLLKRLPALVFHAWPAPPEEGLALLRQGVNAWFSLGTPLLQGNKKAIRSLRQLPAERLLLETDAPYQTLKGQTFTGVEALAAVRDEAARLLGLPAAVLAGLVAANFRKAFPAFVSAVQETGAGPQASLGSPS